MNRHFPITVPVLMSSKVIKDIFPMHDRGCISELRRTWVRGFTHHQPIDKVKDYFGIEIALYFAWLGHYTKALLFPAIFGMLCWTLLPNDVSLTLPNNNYCFLRHYVCYLLSLTIVSRETKELWRLCSTALEPSTR